MRTPAEYIAAVLPPKGHGAQTILLVADAEKAVAQALQDAENYRLFLAAAIRNVPTKPAPHDPESPHPSE